MTTASNRYVGIFEDGKKNGRGILQGDGAVLAGEFSNDRFIESSDLSPGYFLIGLCTHDRDLAFQTAEKHRSYGHRPIVAYSSDWSNLSSGWYILVYAVLADKEEARVLDGFKLAGVPNAYIKYSGEHR